MSLQAWTPFSSPTAALVASDVIGRPEPLSSWLCGSTSFACSGCSAWYRPALALTDSTSAQFGGSAEATHVARVEVVAVCLLLLLLSLLQLLLVLLESALALASLSCHV